MSELALTLIRLGFLALLWAFVLITVFVLRRDLKQPADARWWQGRWVIGDPSCRFNARSPLLRCAVLPEGPCERCVHHSDPPDGATAAGHG